MYHDAKLEKRNETNKFLAIKYFNGSKNGNENGSINRSENETLADTEVTDARKNSNKFCFAEFSHDSAKIQQANLCIRCSKIWFFARLIVTLSFARSY